MKNRVALVLLAVLALLAPAVEATAEPRAPITVRIGVPEPTNLQFMTFWVAVGAGYFENYRLDVDVVAPPMPAQTPQQLLQGQIDAAVLMAPLYLGMIADEHPVKLFQNLLTNDPINLVVDRDLAISPTAPLATRLNALRGLRIGVADNASARTRVLFESVGMDPREDVEIVELHGPDQIPAFTSGAVDALHTHTPFLEQALVDHDALLLVNQSAGEVPELSGLAVHTMVTTDAYLANNGRAVTGMKAAIYRAQRLLLTDPDAALQAVRNSGLNPPRLETIVDLYSRAVPLTLSVDPDSVLKTAGLFVGRPNHPDFARIDVDDYLA
jgi:ABC-type nitrate/sulfonate/bicarbonate transport system substrate-binding protein